LHWLLERSREIVGYEVEVPTGRLADKEVRHVVREVNQLLRSCSGITSEEQEGGSHNSEAGIVRD
jgi:hypothetical protein